MTPSDPLAIIAALGKRTKDASERDALRLAYRALSRDAMAELRAIIPGSRVSPSLLEEDPELGPWCAWIEWRENGTPRMLTTLGKTQDEAFDALRESIQGRHIEPAKGPLELACEREERIAIVAESSKATK